MKKDSSGQLCSTLSAVIVASHRSRFVLHPAQLHHFSLRASRLSPLSLLLLTRMSSSVVHLALAAAAGLTLGAGATFALRPAPQQEGQRRKEEAFPVPSAREIKGLPTAPGGQGFHGSLSGKELVGRVMDPISIGSSFAPSSSVSSAHLFLHQRTHLRPSPSTGLHYRLRPTTPHPRLDGRASHEG